MRTRRSRRRAFNLVELLIVIIIIGALMAVAVPSLLNSRDSAGNSAAQQQLTSAATEIQTAMLRTNAMPTSAALYTASCAATSTCIAPQVEIVSATTASGKSTGSGNAMQVSALIDPTSIVLASAGANGQCWAVKISLREKSFGKFGTVGGAANCSAQTASTSVSPWNNFGFPTE
jgi:prepilin-type N-terminal cleavage/methylation domain-containing protein